MNKFKGVFKKVDINKIYPNDWNPKDNIEENKENKKQFEKIKENIKNKSLYLPIIVRTYKDGWQIVDGYHRWLACKELGYTEIMIWDLGEVDDENAKGITLDSIYLEIRPNDVITAKLVKELKDLNFNLELLPFDDKKIKELLKLNEGVLGQLSEEFNQNIGSVIYEPKKTNWKPEDLFEENMELDKEIEKIKNPILKKMCLLRKAIFTKFNFSRIADYYAYQAMPEEKRVFEKLGLVLLDRDQLIENGFSELIDFIKNINEKD